MSYPQVPLGKVLVQYCEYIESPEFRTYPKLSVKLYGRGVVLDEPCDGATLKMKRHQIAVAGQVILSEIWGKKGAIGIVPAEGDGALCTSHFFLFDIATDRIDPRYLQAIFTANYLQDQLDAEAKGTTGYAAVRPKNLLGATIPLPSMPEQRRIVARIEALAAKIEEARGLRRGAMEEAERFTLSFIDHAYQQALEKWGKVSLYEVCATITDGTHLTPQFSESGVQFIFVGNVSSGRLHFTGSKHVPQEYFDSLQPTRKPTRGDILYSAVGATLGVPAVVDSDEPFCFQRHVAILKLDQQKVLSQYVWHMLRSASIYRHAWSETTGSAQPTVPLRAIRLFPLPVPSIDEQRSIVAHLDSLQAKVDTLKCLQMESISELDALLPSVLDKAFRGEL